MNTQDKFTGDCERIKKQLRTDRSVPYDADAAAEKMIALFERTCPKLGGVPAACAAHWNDTYIRRSPEPSEEPTDAHIAKLSAMLSFLLGDADNTDALSAEDWEALADCVNDESTTLPLETLSSLLAIVVSKKALS